MSRDRILVLGLGNLLMGDEGVGIHAVQELAKRSMPGNVDVVDAGTPGVDLLSLLEGYDRVLIIDAVDAGEKPGAVLRLTAEQVAASSGGFPLSLHQTDILEVLRLAAFVGRLLPPIVIYGIQPDDLGWGTDLSLTVRSRLPRLLDAVEKELVNTTRDPRHDLGQSD
jgi:hydrogenase maturation protease